MITLVPLEARTIVLDPRSVTPAPTATSGVPASNAITESHSHRPAPSHALHSDKQKKAPVGIIVGVALAIVAALFGLFFIRFLFIRRARRRAAFAGPGKTLGGGPVPAPVLQSRNSTSKAPIPQQPQAQNNYAPTGMPMPMPSERDAVELGQYPPPANPNSNNYYSSAPNPNAPPPQGQPTHNPSGSWPTAFSSGAGADASIEPGAGSSPAARQAYLAAELRAAQAQLERGGKDVNTREVKARIRALEERQQSAWALGLE